MVISDSALLTLQEASELLNCHPNTLRQWDNQGILEAVRVGNRGDRRYRKSDIMDMLSTQDDHSAKKQNPSSEETLNRITNVFISFDESWHCTYGNIRAEELLHKTKNEILTKNILEIFPFIKENSLYDDMEKAKEKNKTFHKEVYSSSTNLWLDITMYPSSRGVDIFLSDITEIKNEKKRSAFIAKVHNVLTSTLDYQKTLSNISRLIVPGFADWFSVQILDEETGLKTIEIAHVDAAKVKWAYELSQQNITDMSARQGAPEVVRTGKSQLFADITDEMLRTAAKNEKQLELLRKIGFRSVMVVPLRAAGKITGAVTFVYTTKGKHYTEQDVALAEEIGRLSGVAIDNSRLYSNLQKELQERKRVESSLRASEERLESYLSHSIDAVQVIDKEGNILYCSPSEVNVSGYSKDETIGENGFKYLHPDDRDRIYGLLQDLVKSPGKSTTAEYRVKHKNGSWIWVETTGTNLLNEPNIRGIVINIRNITERKATEDKLREQAGLINNAHDAILMLDTKNEIYLWNPEAEKLYGWTEKEALGKTSQELLKTVFPRPFEEVQESLFKKGSWEGELFHTTKNGKEITVESRWALIKNPEGEIRILEINRDITERKELEERKNEFISTASHELKTPLTSLKVFAQYLQRYALVEGDEVMKIYLQKIINQSENLSTLVADLLDISKIQSGHLPFSKEVFNLTDCIRDRVEVANTIHNHDVSIKGKLSLIKGDKERLCQVFDNLLSNAIKYSPQSKKIEVLLSSSKKEIKVCVKDFGIGIEKKHQKKIFERFYRAGGAYEKTFPGLGIGLYLCSEIIKRHNGKIWVESEKGKGSKFCFTIPKMG